MAFRWYLLAAKKNDFKAQEKLAMFYDKGIGTEIDKSLAIMWKKYQRFTIINPTYHFRVIANQGINSFLLTVLVIKSRPNF